ncbi:hypothetical protein IWQ55_004782 [Labrenzia sp. EL_208]|nr:hypothetical protein [Labrenzia sp. EL_132]MBG6231553.1 hypothetical protein [Labrenzia sp. EL_208]
MATIKRSEILPVTTEELGELIGFSATSGEPISATIPGGSLIIAQTGEKTIRKLAEMRGIKLDS